MSTKKRKVVSREFVKQGLPLPKTVVDRPGRRVDKGGGDDSHKTIVVGSLGRGVSDEEIIRRADGLADARRMRDAIVIVLALLEELDDLMPDEPDLGAFHEIAGLFQDVCDFAAFGAASASRAAGRGHS